MIIRGEVLLNARTRQKGLLISHMDAKEMRNVASALEKLPVELRRTHMPKVIIYQH